MLSRGIERSGIQFQLKSPFQGRSSGLGIISMMAAVAEERRFLDNALGCGYCGRCGRIGVNDARLGMKAG